MRDRSSLPKPGKRRISGSIGKTRPLSPVGVSNLDHLAAVHPPKSSGKAEQSVDERNALGAGGQKNELKATEFIRKLIKDIATRLSRELPPTEEGAVSSNASAKAEEVDASTSIEELVRTSTKTYLLFLNWDGNNNNIDYDTILDNLDDPEPGAAPIREIEEGRLSDPEKEDRLRALESYFNAAKLPESERPALAKKFEIEIARVTRPKWFGRLERGGELAPLSAPLFLKRVHAAEFAADGTISKEVIRAIDSDLMNAVEDYISKATKRGTGLKDAEGLHFAVPRPKSKRKVGQGHRNPTA